MKMGLSALLALCMIMNGIMLAAPAGSRDVVLAANGLTPHAPIRIDSNADFTLANGVNNTATGNGTEWAPWVIENLEINGTGAGYCIYIGNTTEHFVIRNCSLHNSTGPYVEGYSSRSGILLNSASKFLISNVTAYDNEIGIDLYDGANSGNVRDCLIYNNTYGIIMINDNDYVNISDTDIHGCSNFSIKMSYSQLPRVENCTINNTGYCGIGLFWSTPGAIIMNNNISNSEIGLLIYSASATVIKNNITGHENGTVVSSSSSIYAHHNNFWDNNNHSIDVDAHFWDMGYPGGGNYWSDHTGTDLMFGTDQNYTGSDGIVDTPYIIDGDSRDRYPLTAPYTGQWDGDITPPYAYNWFPLPTNVYPSEDIWLVWNEEMNSTSIENGFSYTDGVDTWTSADGSWTHNPPPSCTSCFNPDDSFDYGTNYSVIVNISVTDVEGNHLDQSQNGVGGEPYDWLNFTFTTRVFDGVPPRATDYTPNGTDEPANAPIQITWNETMNWTSVEDSFSYTDGVLNYTSANGSWNHGGITSTFTPTVEFSYETQYYVTVNSTATDFYDNLLDQDGDGTGGEWPADMLVWNFTVTDEAPYIVSTTPANAQVDVDPNKPLKVVFSERMNITSVEAAFSFANATYVWTTDDGVVYWNDERTEFTFSPVEPLPTNQTFNALLDGLLARDYGGKTLDGGNYTWLFRTWKEPPAPHVIDTYPPSGAINVNVNTYINMAFDSSMDTAATEGAFSFTDGVFVWTAANGTVDWFSDNSLMSFQPNERLNFDSTYTVVLNSSAMSIYGRSLDGNDNGIPDLIDSYVFTFTTTPEPPVVSSYYPGDGQTDLPISLSAIYINFSKVMNINSVTNSVSIYPTTAFTPSFVGAGMNLTLVPAAELLEGQQYRVTILGTATDLFGIKLDGNDDGWAGDKFTFSFSTKGIVQPTRPGIVSIFPPNNSTVPVDVFSISITFNVAMNKTSVQEAFTFRNSTATLNGTFLWAVTGTSVKFTPTEALQYNTTYFAGLAGAAKDTNGLTIGNNTIWQYYTEEKETPRPVMDWIIYGVMIFLVMLVGVLYMANRSLRRDLKRTRVKLKRLKREMGIEGKEADEAPAEVPEDAGPPPEEKPPGENAEKG